MLKVSNIPVADGVRVLVIETDGAINYTLQSRMFGVWRETERPGGTVTVYHEQCAEAQS